MSLKLHRQKDSQDCGNACLRTIFDFYGFQYTSIEIDTVLTQGIRGTSLQNLNDASVRLGFKSYLLKLSVDQLIESFNEPLILHVDKKHYVILYKIKKEKFYIGDPAYGKYIIGRKEFEEKFINPYLEEEMGTGLLLVPTEEYGSKTIHNKIKIGHYISYYLRHKSELRLIFACLIISSFIGFLFPILSKSMVDLGITGKNLDLIQSILFAQLLLTIGQKTTEFYRQWIMLYLNTNINIGMVNSFLERLLKQPLRYFESKTSGDLLQRITDHKRVENFVSGVLFNSIFLLAQLVIYSTILYFFSPTILIIYLLTSLANSGWTLLFLRKKRKLDYENFEIQSKDKNYIIDFFTNLRDIKLYGIENYKLESWTNLQLQLFNFSKENLKVHQIQQVGTSLLRQASSFIITYNCVLLYIDEKITFGIFISIQFMIGQLNGPISFFTDITDAIQKVKLSLERLNEIHIESPDVENDLIEEELAKINLQKISRISICGLKYKYQNSEYSKPIFDNLNINLEMGKLNVISGDSGRGKSTLMKILLKIYEDYEGKVLVNDLDLKTIPEQLWKTKCKGVLQGLSLFEDSILNNIILDKKNIDYLRVNDILAELKLKDYIESLPNKWATKVGGKYLNPSEGQKQRILLARLFYSDSDILILDESTNSLDRDNEDNVLKYLDKLKSEKIIILITHNQWLQSKAENLIHL